ncbi:hypothetical protein DICSQDRAFT_152570 [Dichomitus squalens LYAD-421 SS1]|uniref:uncharacterized protein n=1 Tax=Dichomitus squalens (strain LYAD-421) TaxID=732165 RepID=UPI0004414250|nr:uncharacterized protein DICSQDRAFT_152570 [Dichomitus squalens LYAD-421 SS1]EJF65351.1 hypothetical protein DICSQDRAFT_152570 [Dichomitus squalens LYAD-421 SS1]
MLLPLPLTSIIAVSECRLHLTLISLPAGTQLPSSEISCRGCVRVETSPRSWPVRYRGRRSAGWFLSTLRSDFDAAAPDWPQHFD